MLNAVGHPFYPNNFEDMVRVDADKDCEQVFIVTLSKCIWQPGINQIWKSESTSELVDWATAKLLRVDDDKWSSQVRRTGVHPILMCGETCKMCTDDFFVQDPLSLLQVSFTVDNDPL